MSFKLAEAFVELNQRGFGGVMGAIGNVRKSMGGLVSFATGPLGAAMAGIGAGASVAGMVGLAASIEQTETQFATLLGSAELARKKIEELQKFAAGTPFQFDGLAQSAKTLLAFGVANDQVIGTMQVLGDVAAATGNQVGDLANIYGKVRARGALMTESLDQFNERGIPVAKILGETMGKTGEEIREMASKGKISFADLQRAMQSMTEQGGMAFEGMKSQSTTLGGLWSTLKDNVTLLMTDIGQAFVEGFDLKDATANITEFVQNVRSDWMPSIVSSFQWMSQNLVKPIVGAIRWAKDQFGDLVTAWNMAVDFIASRAMDLYQPVANMFGKLISAAVNFRDGFFATFGKVFSASAGLVQDFASDIVTQWTKVLDFLRTGGADLDLASNFEGIFGDIILQAQHAYLSVLNVVNNVYQRIATYFEKVGVVAMRVYQSIVSVVSEIYGAIEGVASSVYDSIASTIGQIYSLVAPVFGEVEGRVQSLGGSVSEWALSVKELIGDVIYNFDLYWELAVTHLANHMSNAWQYVSTFFTNAVTIASWWLENGVQVFTNLYNNAGQIFDAMGDIVGSFFRNGVTLAKWYVDSAIQYYTNLYNNAGEIFSQLGEQVKSIWSSVLDFFRTGKLEFDFSPLADAFEAATEGIKPPELESPDFGKLKQELAAGVEGIELPELAAPELDALQGDIERITKQLSERKDRTPELDTYQSEMDKIAGQIADRQKKRGEEAAKTEEESHGDKVKQMEIEDDKDKKNADAKKKRQTSFVSVAALAEKMQEQLNAASKEGGNNRPAVAPAVAKADRPAEDAAKLSPQAGPSQPPKTIGDVSKIVGDMSELKRLSETWRQGVDVSAGGEPQEPATGQQPQTPEAKVEQLGKRLTALRGGGATDVQTSPSASVADNANGSIEAIAKAQLTQLQAVAASTQRLVDLQDRLATKMTARASGVQVPDSKFGSPG